MNTLSPGEEEGKETFSLSSEGFAVYGSAMITDRHTALMVLDAMRNEVLSTPQECFDYIDLTYRLNRKIPESPMGLRQVVAQTPPPPTPFLNGVFERIRNLRKKK